MNRVLFAGESWISAVTDYKGYDAFPHAQLHIGCERLLEALRSAGQDVAHLPSHRVATDFPETLEMLSAYDVVILSDVGANTLLLPPVVFETGLRFPNRLKLLAEWVTAGGGLMMAGGYLSFQGFGAKANYHGTAVEMVLPVDILPYDDRVEAPEGQHGTTTPITHPITAGLDAQWPVLLGYQKLVAKADASVLAMIEGYPLLAFRTVGAGRTIAFASDISPRLGSGRIRGRAWLPPTARPSGHLARHIGKSVIELPVVASERALNLAVSKIVEQNVAQILTGRDAQPFARDRSGFIPGQVEFAVAIPGTVAEVQAVVRIANELGVPLIARGAGSGYSGGAAASPGALILSLENLNKIVRIDRESQLCVVETEVITAEISAAAMPLALRYSPDPASVTNPTIGGNIATNAGGLCCVKYGVTQESVLTLDVVLANGELIHSGRSSVEGVSGFDLTALFVGSEGTIGVVVGATLRLLPIPPGVPHTIAAYFPTAEEATGPSIEVPNTGVQPSMLELIDEVHLERIDDWQGSALRSRGGGMLLVQTDGPASAGEARIVAPTLQDLVGDVEVTADFTRADELLNVRRWTSQESAPRPEITLNEDLAVPRHNLTEMVASVRDIRERYRVSVTLLAHIGDGNLHANVRIPLTDLDADGQLPVEAWAAADAIVLRALELGGTITGGHGIGILKRRWLRRELGSVQYELQRSLKRFFDQRNILNPGKIFYETETTEE